MSQQVATEIVQHQSPLCWQEQKAGYFLREKGLEKEKQNENKMQNIIISLEKTDTFAN